MTSKTPIKDANERARLALWSEQVMNEAVRDLYPGSIVAMPWYFIGQGVRVWRESDGHSPVEPLFQETDR